MPSMTGTFKFVASNNYDEGLTASESNLPPKEKSILPALATTRITNVGDEWTITNLETLDKPRKFKFKLGERFVETTEDGRYCKSVVTKDGEDKLVHRQRYEHGRILTIIREFTDTEMKVIVEDDGELVSYCVYPKEQE